MSGKGLRCPGCGSTNVIEDDLYCQAQLVCVDCGSVVSEGALASDPVGGSDVSYQRSTALSKKGCVNLQKGVQRLKAMCRTLRLRQDIEDLAQSYYDRAYRHESFLRVSLLKKEILAGCCVLVSCRQRHWPLTMGTISYLVDSNPMVVGAVYQEMLKALSIEAPIVSVTDVLEGHVNEYKLSSDYVHEDLVEEPRVLTKRAVALVELAADTWIVTGRMPAPIMMAAVFLAWQSLKPCKQRLRFTLERFCQVTKVNKHKVAMKRISEMKEVLCKLGKEIPWLEEQVSPDNVVIQMEDILKHRHALLSRAMRAHEEALLAACPPSCEDSPADTASPQTPELQQPIMKASNEEYHVANGHKAEKLGDEDDKCKVNGLQENGNSSENWGKRELFAPPCVVHPKRRRVEYQQPNRQDVTGYEEIEDSEIDSYIRTPREVRDLIMMQNMISEEKS